MYTFPFSSDKCLPSKANYHADEVAQLTKGVLEVPYSAQDEPFPFRRSLFS